MTSWKRSRMLMSRPDLHPPQALRPAAERTALLVVTFWIRAPNWLALTLLSTRISAVGPPLGPFLDTRTSAVINPPEICCNFPFPAPEGARQGCAEPGSPFGIQVPVSIHLSKSVRALFFARRRTAGLVSIPSFNFPGDDPTALGTLEPPSATQPQIVRQPSRSRYCFTKSQSTSAM